jgi:ubiquinone/menaquinone biosynthesis C-methylase UbiE
MAELLLYAFLGLIAFGIAVRVRSLIRPTAFPSWMTPILESPWRKPERIMERSGLAPGERVLEVGTGAGFLTQYALDRVGASGRLVCLDLQREMLRKVRARLGARTPSLVRASGSQLPFRDGVFDRSFLVSVLGEIPDQRGALAEQARVLRRGGVLAVTEALPDPDYVRTPVLRRLAEDAGLRAAERFGNWAQFTQRLVRP